MSKKIIAGLIVLMGISILGIIVVQLVWMNNALRVKNELFSRSVNEALQNTVDKLENRHNFDVVNRMVFEDSVHWVHEMEENFDSVGNMEFHVFPAPKPPPRINRQGKAPRQVKIIREFKPNTDDKTMEIRVESELGRQSASNSFSYLVNADGSVDSSPLVIDGNGGVIALKTDTFISDADSFYSISRIKIDSVLTQLDTFMFMRPGISNRVKKKATVLKGIANKAVSEIFEWDMREIDEELLQEVLAEELRNENIPIDFEFGIVRDKHIQFPIEVSDSAKIANTEFQVNLYPNDIFQKNIKLALFFPNRDGFIYRSLNWLLVFSFLFSVVILLTFALSIFYILRQKKISEMKSDFINNMTHEFKTPIATISVATDSILNKKVVGDPERIRYFAGMIKKENIRMNRQVEDILTIARLDKKDFEFHWEAVDVHELINDAIQGIILQVEKRGGKIDTNLVAPNSMITTDRIHCTNVVYNLLDNAIKYAVNSPEIFVSTQNLPKGVLVSVEDKGIGMSKVVQNKIFERFYRQSSGNVHNVKGFGLGLSYVKAVMEANRGTVSVQSEPEKGSKFNLFLPFVRE